MSIMCSYYVFVLASLTLAFIVIQNALFLRETLKIDIVNEAILAVTIFVGLAIAIYQLNCF